MKTAAIYTRVSSEQQKEEQTIESQVTALQEYARDNGYVVCDQWVFRDEGYSGASLVRPGLEQVRDLAAEGQIEVVLVYGPDRLSRRYAYQVLLLEELARNGVEVVFLRSPQATTPEEELLLQFQGMIAEYERAQITERTRRGKRHRAKAGSVNVLCGAPYGYRYVKKTDTTGAYYEVIDSEAEVVREVYRLYTEEGLSIGKVVRQLNAGGVPTRKGRSPWERTTVWAMLRNPAYKGSACFGKTEKVPRTKVTRPLRKQGGFSKRCSASRERPREEWIEIPVSALISEETFALAQERLQRNKQMSARRTKEPTLLQGMLVCQRCGYAYYRTSTRTSKRKIYYYRCLGSDRWRYPNGAVCDSQPIRQDYLDAVVWEHVVQLLKNRELIRGEIDRRLRDIANGSPTTRRREVVEKAQQRVRNSINKILDAYQEGLIKMDELRGRLPELRKKQQALESEECALQMQAVDEQMVFRLAENLERFLNRLRYSSQSLNVPEKQKILRLVAKEILVDHETVTVKHSIPAGSGSKGLQQPSYLLCKGGNHAPLWRPAFVRWRVFAVFHHSRLQPAADQLQHPWVADATLYQLEHDAMVHFVEEPAYVAIYDDRLLRMCNRALDCEYRLLGAALRAEPVGAGQEVCLEDRLDRQLAGRLNHSIADHGNPERALVRFAGLFDPAALHRFRAIALTLEFPSNLFEETANAKLPLDPLEVLLVYARRSFVRPYAFPRLPQHISTIDLVVERSESPVQRLFRCSGQFGLQDLDFT